MPLLHIAFQDGFTGERVAATVNGRVVFTRDELHTRTQIGFAASTEFDVPSGDTTVGVTVGSITRQFSVPVTRNVYLGVSRAPDGDITSRVSEQPFGYL